MIVAETLPLVLAGERHAAERKSRSACVISCASTGMLRVGRARARRAAVAAVQRLVLAELGVELGHERQATVERVAQRRAREHGVQMRDGPPDAVNRGADLLELAEPIERRLGDTLGALERRALRREHVALIAGSTCSGRSASNAGSRPGASSGLPFT